MKKIRCSPTNYSIEFKLLSDDYNLEFSICLIGKDIDSIAQIWAQPIEFPDDYSFDFTVEDI